MKPIQPNSASCRLCHLRLNSRTPNDSCISPNADAHQHTNHLPIPPLPVLLLPARTPLFDRTRPNPTRLLLLQHALLTHTAELVPKILFVLGRPLGRISKAIPEVLLLWLAFSGGGCRRLAFDKAVECGAGVGDARGEGLSECASGALGLRGDVGFGELFYISQSASKHACDYERDDALTFCIPGLTHPSYPVLPTLLTLAPNHPNPFVSAATGSFWKSSNAGGAPGSSSFFQ